MSTRAGDGTHSSAAARRNRPSVHWQSADLQRPPPDGDETDDPSGATHPAAPPVVLQALPARQPLDLKPSQYVERRGQGGRPHRPPDPQPGRGHAFRRQFSALVLSGPPGLSGDTAAGRAGAGVLPPPLPLSQRAPVRRRGRMGRPVETVPPVSRSAPATPDRAALAAAPPPVRWRPPLHAFQGLNELIDGIRPGAADLPALARVLALRLARAGYPVPPVRASAAEVIGLLGSGRWAATVQDQRLNMGELLSALSRLDEVAPRLQAGLHEQCRLAIGAAVVRISQEHAGVMDLRKRLQPVRPLRSGAPEKSDAHERALFDFRFGVLQLAALEESARATPGQLAICMLQCLQHRLSDPESCEADLLGHLLPAIRMLVAADHIPPSRAADYLDAARRLETMLQVWAGTDLPAGLPSAPTGPAVLGLPARDARIHYLFPLLRLSLDPEALTLALQRRDLSTLLPAVPRTFQDATQHRCFIAMARLTLRPLLDTGLISAEQRQACMQQLKQQVLPAPDGAPVTGSGSASR